MRTRSTASRCRDRLDEHGGSVAKNLRDALHDLGGVVAQTDDGVRTEATRMFQHALERVSPRLLAEIGENRNVAANQCLQAGADRPENGTRTNNDPTNNSKVFD